MQVQFNRLGQFDKDDNREEYHTSDRNDTSLLSTLMYRLIHKPFEVIMRKDFTVTSINNFETLFDDLFQGYAVTEEQQMALKEQVRKDLIWLLKDENNQLSNVFPPHHVKPGEMWTMFIENAAEPNKKDTVRYKLDEIAEEYVISTSTNIKSSSATIGLQEPPEEVELNGTSSTTLYLSKQSCWFRKGEITEEMHGFLKKKTNTSSTLIPTIIKTNIVVKGYEPVD